MWAAKAVQAVVSAAMLRRAPRPLSPAEAETLGVVVAAYELELEPGEVTIDVALVETVTRVSRTVHLADERVARRREYLASRKGSHRRRGLRGVVSCRLVDEDGGTCPALVPATRASAHAWEAHRRAIPVEDLRLHFEEIFA